VKPNKVAAVVFGTENPVKVSFFGTKNEVLGAFVSAGEDEVLATSVFADEEEASFSFCLFSFLSSFLSSFFAPKNEKLVAELGVVSTLKEAEELVPKANGLELSEEKSEGFPASSLGSLVDLVANVGASVGLVAKVGASVGLVAKVGASVGLVAKVGASVGLVAKVGASMSLLLSCGLAGACFLSSFFSSL